MPTHPVSPFRVFTGTGKYIGGSTTLKSAVHVAVSCVEKYADIRVITDKDEHVATILRARGRSRVRPLSPPAPRKRK